MNKLSDFTSYKTGIHQARAYRNLRKFMDFNLMNEDLTSSQWSILGLSYEASPSGGIRISNLAKVLDVEVSFVTNMCKKLQAKNLIKLAKDPDDKRVRLVVVTAQGKDTVTRLEKQMRKNMRAWIGDISASELIAYIAVLQKISVRGHD